MAIDRLASELVKRALKLHSLRLWMEHEVDDAIALEIPGCENSFIATFTGGPAGMYGLTMHCEKDALSAFRKHLGDEELGAQFFEKITLLCVGMDTLGRIPGHKRKVLTAGGFSARKEQNAPVFINKEAHRNPKEPNRSAQKKLLYAINAVILAHEQGILKPYDIFGDKLLTLKIEGSAYKPTIEARYVAVDPGTDEGHLSLEDCLEAREFLPTLNSAWEIGYAELTSEFLGESNAANYLAIVNQVDGSVVHLVTPLDRTPDEIVRHIIDAITGATAEGTDGFPKEILVDDKDILVAISDAMKRLEIPTSYVSSLSELTSFRDSFEESIGEFLPCDFHDSPDEETCEWWRQESMGLCHFLGTELINLRRTGDRLERLFFGQTARAIDFPENWGTISNTAMMEWAGQFHRPTKRSKTVAEILLASDKLNDAQMELLQTRSLNPISFYRIEAVEAGESVTFLDIFSGERHIVHDLGLSNTSPLDHVICAQVQPIREWKFAMIYSNAIPLFRIDGALSHLESLGLTYDKDGITTNNHLIGRLWPWLVKDLDEIPQIQKMVERPLDLKGPDDALPPELDASRKDFARGN